MELPSGVAAWTAAVLSTGTLVGCGPAGGRAPRVPRGRGPAPPAAVAPPVLRGPARPATAAARARDAWRVDPDYPLPRRSPWRPVLAVARRFAAADMSYEAGELGPAVRAAITATCTRAFAAGLLSHPATLPPGVARGQVRQKLVQVTPLERLSRATMVLAAVRSAAPGGAPGAFELRLVRGTRGWRVAALSVV